MKSVTNEMTYGMDCKLINIFNLEYLNLNTQDLITGTDKPETPWNIHPLSYEILTSRAHWSSNVQLSDCSLSLAIFDKFPWHKTKTSMGWPIAINVRVWVKLQVTAILGFHSLLDWCYQTLWQFSNTPEDPEDDTVMENHCAEALYSTVISSMHVIRTEDYEAQQDAAHQILHVALPWQLGMRLEMNLANKKLLVSIQLTMNTCLISSGLRRSIETWSPVSKDKLCEVLREDGRLTGMRKNVSH